MSNNWNNFIEFSHSLLWHDQSLLNYLSERNISEETIKRFRLGKFPTVDQMIGLCDPSWLRKEGLLKDSNKTPFFNFPLIIPINDTHGNCIGIGARTLMSDYKPKYINSIFKKSLVLFGLNEALPTVIKHGAVVVEGYFDVLAAHQNGFFNVVAYCGTSFNRWHISLLSRYTDRIDMISDSDRAGQMTAKKWQNKHIPDIKIRVFKLLPCKDLDEYFNKLNGSSHHLYNEDNLILSSSSLS
jgi:DNA primase